MTGLCPQCYISSFMISSPLVPEKKTYGHDGHISHVTILILINVHFLVPINFHLVTNGPVVSEKNKFSFSYLNDLDHPCSFIYSFSSLHLLIFRPQAAIVSEKYKVLTVTHTNVYANKIDLGLK